MPGVDEARMSRARRDDPRPGMVGLDVECDGDDGCAEWLDDFVECLPPGQARAAASITRPRSKDDLAPAQR